MIFKMERGVKRDNKRTSPTSLSGKREMNNSLIFDVGGVIRGEKERNVTISVSREI